MSTRGAEQYKQRLLTAISGERAPHAVFLDCTDTPLTGGLARCAAAQFCMGAPDPSLLHLCADYHELDDEREIKVTQIRELTAELSRRAFHEGGRAVFLPNAHRMNSNAQNALLKTLEEPPERTLFLLAGNRAKLLPTICSRCHTLHAAASREDVLGALIAAGASDGDARLYADMGTDIQRSLKLFTDPDCRAFRALSLDTLTAFLKGRGAFAAVKALSADVPACADFMLGFMGDMVTFRHTGTVLRCPDRKSDILSLTPRFTTGEVNGIIVKIAAAVGRAEATRSPAAALDSFFSELLAQSSGRK